MEKTSLNLNENVEGLLCYILIWLTGLIFILIEKDNKFVRFHAMQSLFTFLPLTVLGWIFAWIPFIGWVIWLITFILWIVLMVKAYQGEKFKLPIVGDIAEKNA